MDPDLDIDILVFWIRIMLIIASIFTTSFPFLYAFSPWYKSALGRALMLLGTALALAVDMTAFFHFWRPPRLVGFWLSAIVLTLIAVASGWLTYMLWYWNHTKHKPKGPYFNVRIFPSPRRGDAAADQQPSLRLLQGGCTGGPSGCGDALLRSGGHLGLAGAGEGRRFYHGA